MFNVEKPTIEAGWYIPMTNGMIDGEREKRARQGVRASAGWSRIRQATRQQALVRLSPCQSAEGSGKAERALVPCMLQP